MTAAEKNPGAVATARSTRQENTSMSTTDLTALAQMQDTIAAIADDVINLDDSDTIAAHADTFVDSLSGAERPLLHNDLLDDAASRLVLAELVLDECEQSTYDAIESISNVLRATVAAQTEQDLLLRRMVTDKITEQGAVRRLVRALDRKRAGYEVTAWATTHRHEPPVPCDETCGPAFCSEPCAELSAGRAPGGARVSADPGGAVCRGQSRPSQIPARTTSGQHERSSK